MLAGALSIQELTPAGGVSAALAEAFLDIVGDHRLEIAGDAFGPRSVAAFLPSMKIGAAGLSPVPGSEMPMSA